MVLNSVISVIQDIFLVYVKFCVCKEKIFCVLLSFFLRVIVSDNYNNFLILNTVPWNLDILWDGCYTMKISRSDCLFYTLVLSCHSRNGNLEKKISSSHPDCSHLSLSNTNTHTCTCSSVTDGPPLTFCPPVCRRVVVDSSQSRSSSPGRLGPGSVLQPAGRLLSWPEPAGVIDRLLRHHTDTHTRSAYTLRREPLLWSLEQSLL